MSLRFEWDKKKAASNLKKHKVSFDEALTVFDDALASILQSAKKMSFAFSVRVW